MTLPMFPSLNLPKIGGYLVGAVAILGLVYGTIRVAKDWQQNLYETGRQAGISEMKASWNESNLLALQQQRDALVNDITRSNEALLTYVQDIAAKEPLVIKVNERIIEYAKSPEGAARCLDDLGVRLILESRSANGYPSGPSNAAPDTVSGTVPRR